MREILFRGKDTINNEWIYGDLLYYADTAQIWQDSEFGKYTASVVPETLGQFTGLTDKNGVKIFEGDIVETKNGRLAEVIWFESPQYRGWDLKPIECKHPMPDQYDLYCSKNLRVIGDVYTRSQQVDGDEQEDGGADNENS